MPRIFLVALLVFSLVLNGCASSPRRSQPEAPPEQGIVCDPPPQKPEGRFKVWSREHPWLVGTATAFLVAGTITVICGGVVAYAFAHEMGQWH